MISFSKNTLVHIHSFCTNNKVLLEKSNICGCFYCGRIFSPREITAYTDAGKTALCPFCGIDSVLGEEFGYPVTQELLEQMYGCWFGEKK